VQGGEGEGKRKLKKKLHVKRATKLAGKRLWKGLRVSCKFLWSGLALYAKPFGAMDLNVTKAWEEKQLYGKTKSYYNYDDRPAKLGVTLVRPRASGAA
jgi:hypothetical protein